MLAFSRRRLSPNLALSEGPILKRSNPAVTAVSDWKLSLKPLNTAEPIRLAS